jgi:hypothetical protein
MFIIIFYLLIIHYYYYKIHKFDNYDIYKYHINLRIRIYLVFNDQKLCYFNLIIIIILDI